MDWQHIAAGSGYNVLGRTNWTTGDGVSELLGGAFASTLLLIVLPFVGYCAAVKKEAVIFSIRQNPGAWDTEFQKLVNILSVATLFVGVCLIPAYGIGLLILSALFACKLSLWMLSLFAIPRPVERAVGCLIVPFFILPGGREDGMPLCSHVVFHASCFTQKLASVYCSVPHREAWPTLYRVFGKDYPMLLGVFAAQVVSIYLLVTVMVRLGTDVASKLETSHGGGT